MIVKAIVDLQAYDLTVKLHFITMTNSGRDYSKGMLLCHVINIELGPAALSNICKKAYN